MAPASFTPAEHTYRFTPKHGLQVKNNFLSGITLLPLLTILWRHRADVQWLRYALRLGFLLLMACFNSALACVEWALYSRRVAAQELHPRALSTRLGERRI